MEIKAFGQACKDAGARLTPQRIELFREIAARGEHLDAELVFQGVRMRLPSVSLETVYRTLWWLAELGVVTALGPTRERMRFDANLSRDHQFVCDLCWLTRDFCSEELKRLTPPESVAAPGFIGRTQVEVKGVCHACAAGEKARTSMLAGEGARGKTRAVPLR